MFHSDVSKGAEFLHRKAMSFFGSLFGELIPGGDCSSIEQDPHADPFDKWATDSPADTAHACL